MQHFDAFLALPDYRARYLPLLPYMYAALDRVRTADANALPVDAVIEAVLRGDKPMALDNLALPR